MRKLSFLFVLFLPLCFAFSSPGNNAPSAYCPAPSNLHMVSQTSSSVSFNWDDCTCSSTSYRMFFVKDGIASPEYATGRSSITVSGLSAGNYQFYFYSVCAEGTSSIIVEDVIMS